MLKHYFSRFWRVGLALTLLSLPNLIGIAMGRDRLAALGVCIYALALLLLPHAFGLSLKRTLLIWLPAAAVMPAAALYFCSMGYPVNRWLFMVMMETNVEEISSFIGPILIAVLLAPLSIWLGWKLVPSQATESSFQLPRTLRLIPVLIVFLLPCIEFATKGRMAGLDATAARLSKSFPFGMVVESIQAAIERPKHVDRSDVGKKVVLQPSEKKDLKREIHVLVIGEACRYDSWSLHGYPRPTSPKLAATPGLIDFTNVASAATYTALSVPLILTGSSPEEFVSALSRPSITNYFRAAGYKTYWLSTPNKHGVGDTTCSRFAGDAEKAKFLGGLVDAGGRGASASAYDSAIIPELRSILAKNESKVLIVCHTIGSHASYLERYPAEFEKFPVDRSVYQKARMAAPFFSEQAKSALTNAYDNSIAFTDQVLADVVAELARCENAASTFTFVPDHGENGGDSHMLPFAHGVHTLDVLHVPMFMWLSPAYDKAFPEKSSLLRGRRDVAFSTYNLLPTIIDLAGIGSPAVAKEASLCSAKYAEPKHRPVIFPKGAVCQLEEYELLLRPSNGRKGWHAMNPPQREARTPVAEIHRQ